MHHLSEHPHVVRIEGTYEDLVFVHLVMELCAGGELFDRIVQKGHYSEREAVKLIKTIVGVVETCHSLGVMHRDLKPENFLFDSPAEDAKLKATDFGLSVFYKPGWFLGFLPFSLFSLKMAGSTSTLAKLVIAILIIQYVRRPVVDGSFQFAFFLICLCFLAFKQIGLGWIGFQVDKSIFIGYICGLSNVLGGFQASLVIGH